MQVCTKHNITHTGTCRECEPAAVLTTFATRAEADNYLARLQDEGGYSRYGVNVTDDGYFAVVMHW